MALHEAAASFRAIDARRPEHLRIKPGQLPGATEEDRFCRNVLVYVTILLPPGREDAVLRRLERRLDERPAPRFQDGNALRGPGNEQ